MFCSDFSIFESDGTRVGSIIKPSLNPITAHHVVTIFSYPITEQFRDKDLIFPVSAKLTYKRTKLLV